MCLFLPFSSLPHSLSVLACVKASLPLYPAFGKGRILSHCVLERLGVKEWMNHENFYIIKYSLGSRKCSHWVLCSPTLFCESICYIPKLASPILQSLNPLNILKQLWNPTNCFKSCSKNSIVLICSRKASALTKFPLTTKRTATSSPSFSWSTVLLHL